jgi:hypothetical protein
MRLACCALASWLAACSEPAPPRSPPAATIAYYQDYEVSGQPPGFRLQNQIEPARADPKRFFWRATYDSQGRVVRLETYTPPMCLQSQLNLTYAGRELAPAKRQRHPARNCRLALPG